MMMMVLRPMIHTFIAATTACFADPQAEERRVANEEVYILPQGGGIRPPREEVLSPNSNGTVMMMSNDNILFSYSIATTTLTMMMMVKVIMVLPPMMSSRWPRLHASWMCRLKSAASARRAMSHFDSE